MSQRSTELSPQACLPMDGIIDLSFPYLILPCRPKAPVSVHPSHSLPGKPLTGSGRMKRRVRPYSCTVHMT